VTLDVVDCFGALAEYRGEIASLAAAFAWAITSLIFVRVRVPAAALNLFKNAASCVFLFLTLVAFALLGDGAERPGSVVAADVLTWSWLVASAVIGLVIGDHGYFRSLQILGARRALILLTLTPPSSALIAGLVLGERLGASAWVGMALTLAGVVWVVRERMATSETPGHYPGSTTAGVLYGLLGCIGQAAGAVLSKLAMARGIEPLDATFARMLIAVVAGLALAMVGRRVVAWTRALATPHVLARLVPASFLGTYLGVWACLFAYRHTEVGVATTLQSTSPIFVLPLVWIVLRQPVSARAALGALLAVAGIAVLLL